MGGMSSLLRRRDRSLPGHPTQFASKLHTEPDAALAPSRDEVMATIARIDAREISAAEAVELLEHPDLYVVRVLAGSPYRDVLPEESQYLLLYHPDSTVRFNFVRGNTSLPKDTLRWVAKNDPDPHVRHEVLAQAT